MNARWLFLTLFYSGHAPKAPGTVGSFVALLLGIAILMSVGAQTLFLAAMLITVMGIKLIDNHEAQSGTHDDKRIVIDELAGMWIALSIAPGMMFDAAALAEPGSGVAIQLLLSFALFRYFDIKKPSIIGRIDREVMGGKGVMGDDVIAGFAAGICSAGLWQIGLKLLG